ncbi:39S ribosomal protein L10, mitochondrial [Orussus abietinus]|uniref:39S ribosomal protein L10, mitochondrial n=1 Tax=Orussus abietinus TaxID=222816 RepID=UPI000625DB01|nr:39S ribosomal protein L10, mitochondrial [Orussus abietinus]
MSLILNRVLREVKRHGFAQQKRFRGKINIQRPQKLHFERQKVMDFVTPFYRSPNLDIPLWEKCRKSKQVERESTENPYRSVVARIAKNWLDNSKMVAFLHQNSISKSDTFDLMVALRKHNIYLKSYGRKTMEEAVMGTRFEAILSVYCSENMLAFCTTGTPVAQLEKTLKRAPQYILLAGILEGKLLHLNDFLRYGKMDLQSTQVGLVQVLQSAAGGSLNHQLTYHQTTLVSRLNQIATPETPTDKTDQQDDKDEQPAPA